MLDGRITLWHERVITFLGQVSHNTAITVQVPDTTFRTMPNVQVKTVHYIVTHLNHLGDVGMSVVPVDDADSMVVTTMQPMYLPAKYASNLVEFGNYFMPLS